MKRDQIVVDDSVLSKIEKHCFGETLVEVGGFLLGELQGEEVKVKAHIPALKAVSADTHLTFGHEAWDDAYKVQKKKFPNLEIVGWYHTHPDFGCFLSEYDRFIQENFFTTQGHLALVVDPIRGEIGWFATSKDGILEVAQEKTQATPVAKSKGEVLAAATDKKAKLRRVMLRTFSLVAVSTVIGLIAFSVGQSTAQSKLQPDISSTRAELQATIVQLQQNVEELNQKISSAQTFSYSYTVQPGDSVWSITQKYLGDGSLSQKILDWNPTLKNNSVNAGDLVVIHLPGKFLPEENSTKK